MGWKFEPLPFKMSKQIFPPLVGLAFQGISMVTFSIDPLKVGTNMLYNG
jgi:hypothetical protein